MKRVLFVGNSHTYYNDMPYFMEFISKNCGVDNVEVQCTMLASPGQSLAWHSTQEDVRYNIIYGGYDFIIFQNNAHPFDGYEALKDGTNKLLNFINDSINKPTVVMYMTWSEKEKPENFSKMREAYIKVADEFNLKLAPVGEKFSMVSASYDTELYAKDGEHASPVGSYIVALTILQTLFDIKICGFPRNIEHGSRVLYSLSDAQMQCIKEIFN